MIKAENNKRIAKNTLLLYFRMVFLMGVTLYTSRVVLNLLGVTDFGIYNVVGGIVTMLGFMSSSLSGASSRFITFELGKGDEGNVYEIFRCAVTVHYILAIIIFLFSETVGLWFLYEKMSIPENRFYAAFWVYQCSVATFIVSILNVPYNALIIAHERMNAFAYISLFEALANLSVALLLNFSASDLLIEYAILIFVIKSFVQFFYMIYCKKNFKETSSRWLWNKKISKEITFYAGWTINGNLAAVGYTQGINILLNLFFGPVVNAARGIAVQVQYAINQLCTNFLMAVRPQITKSYAQNDLDYMHSLIINSSRYSFFLVMTMAFPILLNTDFILKVWLGLVPEHTVNFTRLMIIVCMNRALSQPVIMGIHATGDIKKFQIIEGSILLSVVPISYILLKYFNVTAEIVLVVYLLIEIVTQFARVFVVYPRIHLSIRRYFVEILFPIFKCLLPMLVIAFVLYKHFFLLNIFTFILNCIICLFLSLIIIFFIGLTSGERTFILRKIKLIK